METLKNNVLETRLGNGRWEIRHRDRLLTSPGGIYISIRVSDDWYESQDGRWSIIENTGTRITAIGEFPDFRLEWEVSLPDEGRLGIRVFLFNESTIRLKETQLNILGDRSYSGVLKGSEADGAVGEPVKGFWEGRPMDSCMGLNGSPELPPLYIRMNGEYTPYCMARMWNEEIPDRKKVFSIVGALCALEGVELEAGGHALFDSTLFVESPPMPDYLERKVHEDVEAMVRGHFRNIGVGEGVLEEWVRYATDTSRGYVALNEIESLTGPIKGMKVLDAGCGWGILSDILEKAGNGVYSFEHVLPHIKGVKTRNGNVGAVVASGTEYPFLDGFFDIVIANDVLEHVGNFFARKKMMMEAARVVKPGGLFFFSTGNFLWPYNYERFLWCLHWLPRPLCHWYVRRENKGEYYHDAWIPIWGTPWGLKAQARKAGFEILKVDSKLEYLYLFNRQVKNPFLVRLLRRFYRTFNWFLPSYYVVCRKVKGA